jgi:hypothetical protein
VPRIDIPFIIDKQVIRQHPAAKISAGSKNYFYATFTLSEIWDDLTNIKASFSREGMTPLVLDLEKDENGRFECQIPWEMMAERGYFYVGVFGGNTLPTNTDRVYVDTGCALEGGEPQPPTPDWFSKMDQQIGDIASLLETI